MGIYRIQKDNNFVTMDKTALKDERLSWKAKGLHAYMLSLPDDWTFYDSELEKHAKDGRDSLKSAVKELKDHGYLIRNEYRKENGQIAYETTVVEKPSTVKPLTENPKLLNNDVLEEEDKGVPAHSFYMNNIGNPSPFMMESIDHWIDEVSNDVVVEAMKQAVSYNALNWKYVEKVLMNWSKKDIDSMEKLQAMRNREELKKQPKQKKQFEKPKEESNAEVNEEIGQAFM